jgi:hypothetical protein
MYSQHFTLRRLQWGSSTRVRYARENQEQRAKAFNVRFIAGTTLATRREMWVFGIQANAQGHTQEDP